MRFRLTTIAATTAATVLLTSACGSISPAQSAAEEFESHFTSTYPDEVLEAVTTASGKWPWARGDMSGSLVLADDTSPEQLATILDDVTAWAPEENSSYDGVGVLANGLCLSSSDPQLEHKHLLRDRLYAEGLALQGTWPCPTWLSGTTQYTGTLAELMQDTETVRSLWTEADGELRVVAAVNTPHGAVDHVWTQIPQTAHEVLTAVRQEHPLRTFELTDAGLRVAVTATTRIDELQELADGVAGADLIVEVMQGSLDADKAAQIEELAAVVDQVRAVPGVTAAEVPLPGQLVIGVEDSAAIRAAHEAATTHPDLGAARVEITLDAQDPEDEWARHRYFWAQGGTEEALDAFLALTAHDTVSFVSLSNTPAPSASVNLTVPLADGFAHLKPALPDGLPVEVSGSDALASVEFTAARTLAPDDLTSRFTTPDLDQLASDWNAAP
ncbi:hypothetical protein NF556_02920 [Ornithinimicrobium faecis]|uniref:Lipoprotein n=1 Tax=Ornithinimicrobium faecis TaxID=2934158 RepID=A0ABY4YVP6_9MICO|nr:hypothetical protein [Ornithinimicrobium sp. HY1793]USQ80629.1 hypothetical protein NF556_02920 [Ornithinimicrobium sp. HY1793]